MRVLSLLLFLILTFSINSIAQGRVTDRRKVKDKKENQYYVFGIHSVTRTVADSFYRKYGVKIISSSCVLDMQKMASNRRIDSLMVARHSQSLTSILRTVR